MSYCVGLNDIESSPSSNAETTAVVPRITRLPRRNGISSTIAAAVQTAGGVQANDSTLNSTMPPRLPRRFQLYPASRDVRPIRYDARCPSGIKHKALKLNVQISIAYDVST